jgi:hypothetical protein
MRKGNGEQKSSSDEGKGKRKGKGERKWWKGLKGKGDG